MEPYRSTRQQSIKVDLAGGRYRHIPTPMTMARCDLLWVWDRFPVIAY